MGAVLAACSGPAVQTTTTTPTATNATTTTEATTATAIPSTTTTSIPLLSVVGKVVGPDDAPVSNARVSIDDTTTLTGADGLFDIETPGPATLTVSRPGWTSTTFDWGVDSDFARVSIEPRKIRGLRVGAGAAGDDGHFERLLAIAADTAINAFVFDTKQEGGRVLYETTVPEAQEIGAADIWYDPARRVSETHEAGLYAITRIVVFEDPLRAAARPDEKMSGWWLDPRAESVWEYNIALATEACRLGFDEVQFDYVRFPAGRTATVSGQLRLTEEERVAAIAGFLAAARSVLEPIGCPVSADIFAIVVSMEDDQGLGQRPEDLSRHVHALSPMVYPSHYSPGWLGFSDPNDHPYAVTADAIDDAVPRMARSSVLRPWIQAFWWSNTQIRSAIQAAEDRGVGWILWNVSSDFDREAIPTDAEVGQ